MQSPHLFTIPPTVSFADTLVQGIIARYGMDAGILPSITLLLPDTALCNAVRECFLKHSNGTALLLPTIVPITAIEEKALLFRASVQGKAILPAIPLLEQQLHLAQRIHIEGCTQDITQAVELADELARFLAELYSEEVEIAALEHAVPAALRKHFEPTLRFFHLLGNEWPAWLSARGLVTPAERRRLMLAAQCAVFASQPPAHPIIAAGLTGSNASMVTLLAAIAMLPQGVVVLPMLDKGMEVADWQQLPPTHPEWQIKRLLERVQCLPKDVMPWYETPAMHMHAARTWLVREVLRPAASSDSWQALESIPAKALAGIHTLQSPSLQEEAAAIACALREALEVPGARVALITAERNLATRVAALMQHWDITVHDSAGCALQATPSGTFLHLLLAMVEAEAAPIPLLSLLKHPFAAAAMEPWQFQQQVRALEIAVLRGVRLAPGLGSITQALAATENVALTAWFAQLETVCAPFIAMFTQEEAAFDALLTAHIALAEALATTHEQEGSVRLWEGESGKHTAQFLTELLSAASVFGTIPTARYPELFNLLLSNACYRPEAVHPRLSILKPSDARLQSFDMVVLGGLTEGCWPAGLTPDPWLNATMREQIGLPPREQVIGQMAHDFAFHFHAPKLVLSWSDKVDGTPTVPSRWLLRLFTVLTKTGLAATLEQASFWGAWAEMLNQPIEAAPLTQPTPTPPLAARPRLLSVTHVERWMRDPYALYASKILKLRALDPLDADPGMAEFGNFIHKALDQFSRLYPITAESDRTRTLLACGEAALSTMLERSSVKHFWMPRFARIVRWIIPFEAERRAGKGVQVFSEIEGRMTLGSAEHPFTLTAKADRLEYNGVGEVALIDYKTGSIPSAKDVALGVSPQLTLEALIAENQGFPGVKASRLEVKELLYIRLTGGEAAATATPIKNDIATLAQEAKAGLECLIADFDKEETAYLCCPVPGNAPRFNDYEHLSRIKEWRERR